MNRTSVLLIRSSAFYPDNCAYETEKKFVDRIKCYENGFKISLKFHVPHDLYHFLFSMAAFVFVIALLKSCQNLLAVYVA